MKRAKDRSYALRGLARFALAPLLVAPLLVATGCDDRGEDSSLREEVGPERVEQNDSAQGAPPGIFADEPAERPLAEGDAQPMAQEP